MFSGFYLIMELFQVVQWQYGELLNEYHKNGPVKCSINNQFYTMIAYVLIWLQPFLFSLIGYYEINRRIFGKLMIFNIMVFLYAIGILWLGTEMIEKADYSIDHSFFGQSTCTDVGPTHHLSWRIRSYSIDIQPNHFSYLILCMIPFIFYENELFNIAKGWGFALLVTKLLLWPTATEYASSWCFMSIFANLVILLGAKY